MKFLMDETGTVAVNTAFVSEIHINEETLRVRVIAYDSDYNEFTLQKFDSDDKDKNLIAAKKYFVELVDKLNSGGNL